jgi:transcriptional regulator with XRE-family HTH domain
MGMTEVAKKAGVTRASLYKSLSETGNPRFETISKVTKALGCPGVPIDGCMSKSVYLLPVLLQKPV